MVLTDRRRAVITGMALRLGRRSPSLLIQQNLVQDISQRKISERHARGIQRKIGRRIQNRRAIHHAISYAAPEMGAGWHEIAASPEPDGASEDNERDTVDLDDEEVTLEVVTAVRVIDCPNSPVRPRFDSTSWQQRSRLDLRAALMERDLSSSTASSTLAKESPQTESEDFSFENKVKTVRPLETMHNTVSLCSNVRRLSRCTERLDPIETGR